MLVIGGCHERGSDLQNQQDGYCWKLMDLLGLHSVNMIPYEDQIPTNMDLLTFLEKNLKSKNNDLILLSMNAKPEQSELNLFFRNIVTMEKMKIRYIIIDACFVDKDNIKLINKFTDKHCLFGFPMIEPKYMNIYHFFADNHFPRNELYHYGPEAHTAFAEYVYNNYIEWKNKKGV